MSSTTKTVLITGATGKQGGAVVSALLASGSAIQIKALTRNTESAASQSLKSKGVQMVKGDLLNKAALIEAFKGVDAAFLVTDNSGPEGPAAEIKQGFTFVEAAKEAQISHVVFTSVISADTARYVPHFDSKFQVEEQLKETGLKWTILRPVAFMDNFPTAGFPLFGALSFFNSLLGPRRPLEWIAVEDIGRVAAQALISPQTHTGQIIDLAGDDLSMDDVVTSIGKAAGSKPWKIRLPYFLVMAILPYDFKQMVRFWHKPNPKVDIASLRSRYPGLMTFEDWARKNVKGGKV